MDNSSSDYHRKLVSMDHLLFSNESYLDQSPIDDKSNFKRGLSCFNVTCSKPKRYSFYKRSGKIASDYHRYNLFRT
ncbi:MAG: hypothetical protein KGD67_01060 [Candidatus Lokiarchaeota archaeon]|nr:hypothetical protein [Candidatus Lokiarchaeota archaeon]